MLLPLPEWRCESQTCPWPSMVTDGNIEIVSEGRWALFDRLNTVSSSTDNSRSPAR